MMENNVTVITSLDQMHDIIIPSAVSLWPLAPGWYALLLLVLTYGIHAALKYWSLYQKNLYRREALEVLSSLDTEDASKAINSLLGLMKRAGLQHFGREKVASLSQNEWWDFVERHSKAKADKQIRELSQKILYTPDAEASREELKAFSKVAKVWINTHHGETDA